MGIKLGLALSAGLLLLIVIGIGFYLFIVFPNSKGPGRGEAKEIEVSSGTGPKQLAARLYEAGVVSSPGRFALWVRLTGGLAHIKAGRFRLLDNATPKEILSVLSGRGIEKGIKVTIPEGFTLSRIGQTVENAGLARKEELIAQATSPKLLDELGAPGPTFEGYLFPDTYFFEASQRAPEIIDSMWSNFKEQLASIGSPKGSELKRIASLASIVQAEARVKEEMPIIAGVYANRLDGKDFPTRLLQADPSVAYGCEPFVEPRAKSCLSFKGTLTRRQLDDPQNPYNTYAHPGLPPGPICAPGLDALKAAARPADVPYFYFVVSAGGRHAFSKTLNEHRKAVDRYRRGGK